ncbi:unnamed protein product [Caenorhabditis bovis]|uniref:Elongin-A n=1 Tax=Caenorhabditis bovis TaxID=2654633 RepID=A0A8S1FCV9_9PELO|nr:unnamed protein product [Caenorhabditis bovis]
MSVESASAKVRRYTENLKSGFEPKRALKRLYEIDADAQFYQEADTRKYLKRYLEDETCKKYAARLRQKLRGHEKIINEQRKRHRSSTNNCDVSSQGAPPLKEPKTEQLSADDFARAICGGTPKASFQRTPVNIDYSKYKVVSKTVVPKAEPPSPKEDNDVNIPSSSRVCLSSTDVKPNVETISLHVSDSRSEPAPKARPKAAVGSRSQDDEKMFKPRKDRQKVFAGRKKNVHTEVPSLMKVCQNVIAQNVNSLGYVGWTPYILLKPALTRCNIEQLRKIVDMNPTLAEDADELFHEYVKREFPANEDKTDEMSWRELYDQLVIKKERYDSKRLAMLADRIACRTNNHDSGRRTMVIESAHANVRRAFTSSRPTTQMLPTPSAVELSQARKNVSTQGRAQLNALQGPIRSAVQTARPARKTVAPLMAKVKKMLGR